jgi:putative transposase
MSHRYRLYPTPEQVTGLLEFCAHARYVYNLAWNLHQFGTLETYGNATRYVDRDGNVRFYQKRRPVRRLPNLLEQCRMLTEARAEFEWLGNGSVTVQQQALRDFDAALQKFYGGTHGYPGLRKAREHEGFRITGKRGGPYSNWDTRRLNRRWGEVKIPKVGWVRFRWSRPVPEDAKSYRVTMDKAGRWHVAFAGIPAPVPGPQTGEVVGVDCGVVITAALSTGEELHCPVLSHRERAQLRRAHTRLRRAPKDTPEHEAARLHLARLYAREKDRRRDWIEKTSTDLARRFDVIRFENLNVQNLTRSAKGTVEKPGKNVRSRASRNRAIRAQGWGTLMRRTEDKAPGRVEKVPAAYTSLRCSACGHVDPESRDSQADFCCTFCGFTCNADINAALNIAAGHAVGLPPSNREPLAVT